MVVRHCDVPILCWCCMSSRSTTFAALFDRLDRWFGLTYHRLSFVCVVICDVAAFCLTLMDTSNSRTLDSARSRYSWRTRRSRSVGQWSIWHLKLSTAKGTTRQLTGGRTACWWYVVVQFSSVPFGRFDVPCYADASQAIFEPPLENWRRPPRWPCTTCLNIHDDLFSLDLGICDARDTNTHTHTHTHTRLTALFWDYPGEPVPER